MMTYPPHRQRRASTASKARQSLKQQLRQQASELGLPKAKSIFPEGKLSPNYGDPTAVDDRPFVRV